MHKFMKLAGCKTEKKFYDKYPSEEHFFAEHPHMKEGGYTPHQGVLPAIMPGMYPGNMPVLMNQQATMPMNMGIPEYGQGGYHAQPGYYYNGHSMQKAVGSGTYANGVYFENGGYTDSDGDADMMKKGGIHIKKANVGKFTAYKKRTGKTTEEALHNPDPHVRQMANFARNAKKWHHQYGGPAGNPFHPMHQYAVGGPFAPGDPDEELNTSNVPSMTGPQQMPGSSDQYSDPAATGAAQPVYASQDNGWNKGMNQQQMQQNVDYGAGSVDAYDPLTGNTDNGPGSNNAKNKQPRQYKGLQVAAGIVGAGAGILGAASMYHDRFHNQQVQQQWMRDQNKSDNLPKYQNPMAKGTTDQYGNMPYNNMSQSANIRTMKDGGYVKGQEVELDEKQINELIRQGYKLQKL